jgi:hypothetical protein
MDLKPLIKKYNEFMTTEGKDLIVETEKKNLFFKKFFKKENLEKIDEGALREFIKMLWSYDFWNNKDYILEEMLKTGIENIKKAFDYLVYSEDIIDKRFDYVLKNVRMIGVSAISELLVHSDSKKYPFWTRRTKDAVSFLGYKDKILDSKGINISGKQYQSFIKIMSDLLNKVKEINPDIDNFLKLNLFIFYISSELTGKEQPEVIEEFDHNTTVDDVFVLGDGLGFEVAKEVNVAPGCRVDVIWKSRIANLGLISYAFEVHNKGSMDSAILNLQKVLHKDSSIQKVVLVSNIENIIKFREQIGALNESFREKVGYFEINELNSALDNLKSLKENLSPLGFMNVKKDLI